MSKSIVDFFAFIIFNINIPFDKIMGFEISPIFKRIIFSLITLLSEFSFIQPIFPPILADSEKLYIEALLAKPILFMLSIILLYFSTISSLFLT